MYNKLFKLIVLSILLSLSILSFSCKHNDNNTDKSENLFCGLVHCSGFYYKKIDTGKYQKFSFRTGNEFTISSIWHIEDNDTSAVYEQYEEFFKIVEVTRIGESGEYRIDAKTISVKETLYTDEIVTKANNKKYLGYTDWQVEVTKEVLNNIEISQTPFWTFSISENKNYIVLTGNNRHSGMNVTYDYHPY